MAGNSKPGTGNRSRASNFRLVVLRPLFSVMFTVTIHCFPGV